VDSGGLESLAEVPMPQQLGQKSRDISDSAGLETDDVPWLRSRGRMSARGLDVLEVPCSFMQS
jgi:hypothetical protein